MNRLVSLVMLVAFAVQHFACCCGGMTGMTLHACGHDHPANAGQKCVYTYEHTHPHDHNDHDRGPFDDEHDANCDAEDADHESCPCDGRQQHHVCFGTHVFFFSAPRAEVPNQDLSHGVYIAGADVLNQMARTVRTAAGHHGVDYGPPFSSCLQRSALCVYRI